MIRPISIFVLYFLRVSVVSLMQNFPPKATSIPGFNRLFLLRCEDDASTDNNGTQEITNGSNSLLHEWAAQSGIEFSSGVQVEDGNLILTEPCNQGDILIDIPESIILSSEYYDNSSLMTWIEESIGKTYIAECLLMLRVLEETSKGRQSTWYPWLQSLPTSFRTGIYWDERERSCVQQMAPGFLTMASMFPCHIILASHGGPPI
jgi:hypothetical protein